MWNGFDEDVDYCHPSELHGSMAYAAEKVVCFAPKRYDPVEIGHFLAQLLADTDWAEEAEAWLAERNDAPRRAVFVTARICCKHSLLPCVADLALRAAFGATGCGRPDEVTSLLSTHTTATGRAYAYRSARVDHCV